MYGAAFLAKGGFFLFGVIGWAVYIVAWALISNDISKIPFR